MFDSFKPKRRRVLSALKAAVLIASLGSVAAFAQGTGPQGYPHTGRVVIVVPFAPGGATDIIGRLIADELGKRWGTAVVVENKAGAGGGIGTEYVARAKPDGYTLLLGTQTALAVNPHLLKKISYDVEKDFAPITELADTPWCCWQARSPARAMCRNWSPRSRPSRMRFPMAPAAMAPRST